MKDMHFYVGFGLAIFAVATGLVYFGKISGEIYSSLVQWDVMSVCGGGAFSALRRLGGGANGK